MPPLPDQIQQRPGHPPDDFDIGQFTAAPGFVQNRPDDGCTAGMTAHTGLGVAQVDHVILDEIRM